MLHASHKLAGKRMVAHRQGPSKTPSGRGRPELRRPADQSKNARSRTCGSVKALVRIINLSELDCRAHRRLFWCPSIRTSRRRWALSD
jgi:hypothetical protein